LIEEIPRGEAERAAIADSAIAYENLLSSLASVPPLAGPTLPQIGAELVYVRPPLPVP
jgi:hypothetical protein